MLLLLRSYYAVQYLRGALQSDTSEVALEISPSTLAASPFLPRYDSLLSEVFCLSQCLDRSGTVENMVLVDPNYYMCHPFSSDISQKVALPLA